MKLTWTEVEGRPGVFRTEVRDELHERTITAEILPRSFGRYSARIDWANGRGPEFPYKRLVSAAAARRWCARRLKAVATPPTPQRGAQGPLGPRGEGAV